MKESIGKWTSLRVPGELNTYSEYLLYCAGSHLTMSRLLSIDPEERHRLDTSVVHHAFWANRMVKGNCERKISNSFVDTHIPFQSARDLAVLTIPLYASNNLLNIHPYALTVLQTLQLFPMARDTAI